MAPDHKQHSRRSVGQLIFGAIGVALVIVTVVLIVRRETKAWTVDVENQTDSQVAVIGLNDRGEGLGFDFVPPGERRRAGVSTGERPAEIQVLFEAGVDEDGFPRIGSRGFIIWCSYDAARDAEPLTASRLQPLGCEEE